MQLSVLLSLLSVALLALAGRRPYVDEFRGRIRQIIAAVLLIGVLALTVFAPLTAFGEAGEIDPAMLWLPLLFAGHVVLTGFLVVWWRLRGDISAAAFVRLSASHVGDRVWQGVRTGLWGWLITVVVTGAVAAAVGATGSMASPGEVPPLMVWLAELPLADKLLIVVVAMTVEEAFFRGFLQSRFGLTVSSVLFACSHFSYGLPFMIVGVFTISVIIGRAFARHGDLLPCMVAHGVFDAIQLFVILPWAVRLWMAGVA